MKGLLFSKWSKKLTCEKVIVCLGVSMGLN